MAFLLTLFIFSYLIGDNPLFRIAVYIFVGVSAGYVAAVACRQVLWPDLFFPLFTRYIFAKGFGDRSIDIECTPADKGFTAPDILGNADDGVTGWCQHGSRYRRRS